MKLETICDALVFLLGGSVPVCGCVRGPSMIDDLKQRAEQACQRLKSPADGWPVDPARWMQLEKPQDLIRDLLAALVQAEQEKAALSMFAYHSSRCSINFVPKTACDCGLVALLDPVLVARP